MRLKNLMVVSVAGLLAITLPMWFRKKTLKALGFIGWWNAEGMVIFFLLWLFLWALSVRMGYFIVRPSTGPMDPNY